MDIFLTVITLTSGSMTHLPFNALSLISPFISLCFGSTVPKRLNSFTSSILSPRSISQCLLYSQCLFFFLALTVGASRLIEAQMDLPRLLFGAGFQIFIVTTHVFRFSRDYVENVRG